MLVNLCTRLRNNQEVQDKAGGFGEIKGYYLRKAFYLVSPQQ